MNTELRTLDDGPDDKPARREKTKKRRR
jgi:hypothetical protein